MSDFLSLASRGKEISMEKFIADVPPFKVPGKEFIVKGGKETIF